ncbi:centrosomal protein of 170 kDa protein B-like isoform X3 [Ornithodoros turicata]
MDQRVGSGWSLISRDKKCRPLTQGMIFVGRQECDIVVDSLSVDKRHAVIFFNPSDKLFHIKDLNSGTGTYLNGTRIPEQTYVKLSHMDCLRFGYGHETFCVIHEGSPMSPFSDAKHEVVVQDSNPAPEPIVDEEPSFCEELQEADSLEDLSRTEESVSTVREVLSPPALSHCTKEQSPTRKEMLLLKEVSPVEQSAVKKESSPLRFPADRSPVNMEPPPLRFPTDCSPVKREISPLGFQTEPSPVKRELPPLGFLTERSPVRKDGSFIGSLAEQSPIRGESSPLETVSPPALCPEVCSSPETSPQVTPGSSTAFTIPFGNEEGSLPSRRLGLKDGIRKFAPPKVERPTAWSRPSSAKSGDSPGSGKNCITPLGPETSNGKRRLEARKEADHVLDLKTALHPTSNTASKPAARPTSLDDRLTDSATYLIQRMLSDSPFSGKKPPQAPPRCHKSPISPQVPQLPSPGDDRSETGTYTVGLEKADPAVEEARRKIDEVFGVAQRTLPSKIQTKPQLESCFTPQGSSGNSSPLYTQGSMSPIGRPKRRLPTPPTEQPSGTATFTRRPSAPPVIVESKATPPSSPLSRRRLTRPSSGMVDGAATSRPPATSSRPNTVSAGGRTPCRRTPWALSSSDVDLTKAKTERSEETASVVSDTSTEPSSHSSGSQGGPQMKLNRAFALRRARLGLGGETSPANSKPALRSSNPNLSRQDGGRYSLRLPRGANPSKGGKRCNDTRQQEDHKRPSVSDTERSSPLHDTRISGQSSLGRSSSFGAGDLLNGPATGSNLNRGDTFLRAARNRLPATERRKEKAQEVKEPVENGTRSSGKKELSALDSLVISAIYQLSGKLRTNARSLIERERFKFPENSEARLMMEELLPRVVEPSGRQGGDSPPDGNVTRELSTILKNLKRIEQSLDVLNSLAANEPSGEVVPVTKKTSGGFFYVDV